MTETGHTAENVDPRRKQTKENVEGDTSVTIQQNPAIRSKWCNSGRPTV